MEISETQEENKWLWEEKKRLESIVKKLDPGYEVEFKLVEVDLQKMINSAWRDSATIKEIRQAGESDRFDLTIGDKTKRLSKRQIDDVVLIISKFVIIQRYLRETMKDLEKLDITHDTRLEDFLKALGMCRRNLEPLNVL